MANSLVQHDRAACRFSATLNGHASELDYEFDAERGGTHVTFTHTFVPPALRGHGIAALLVEAALHWAQSEGLRVVPACSYVAVYIQRHPQWKNMI